ncbi:MAG: DUF4340 domain-containing protein [Eubacterium sp.]|nr:DUF4340 domain-containing protein [Eubacterium sp.]
MSDSQKRQLIALLGVLVIAVAILVGALLYNKIQSDKEAAEEEAAVLIELEYDDIESVSYTSESGDAITLVHAYDEVESSDASGDESGDSSTGYWYCAEDESLSIDYDTVYSMVSNFESLSCTDTVDEPGELSDYGLDDPSNVITIIDVDGVEYVLTIGDSNSITSEYYALFNDDETIYTIDSTVPAAFTAELSSLIEEESSDAE